MRTGDLIDHLNRATQAADSNWKHPDVTPRQFLIMRAIDDLTAEGVRVNQLRIVEATGMDRSTLAEVLRRLELRKLVARKRDKNDRRSLHVTLTGTGRAMMTKLEPDVHALEQWIRLQVSARDLPGFLQGVKALADRHTAAP